MQSLIHEAYTNYGFLTPGIIERLRLKHRLRVVQQLEAGAERSVVRSLQTDGFFTSEELQVNNHYLFFNICKLLFLNKCYKRLSILILYLTNNNWVKINYSKSLLYF